MTWRETGLTGHRRFAVRPAQNAAGYSIVLQVEAVEYPADLGRREYPIRRVWRDARLEDVTGYWADKLQDLEVVRTA